MAYVYIVQISKHVTK